jgi:hypothetical protein
MIKNASRMWGYSDVQDINSFDPVLGLIIGALAGELYNISHEIRNADARVTEKLLDVLFSRNMFSLFPAHAVACAQPMQSRVCINKYYQFFYPKERYASETRNGSTDKKNIWFTPLNTHQLFKGEVKYLAARKFLYEISGRSKEIIVEKSDKTRELPTKLFIGARLDHQIDLLDGLSLYFSFKNVAEGDRFYHALQNATWKINGKEVSFINGLEIEHSCTDPLEELLKRESDLSYRAVRFVHDYYRKNFMILPNNNFRKNDFQREENELQYLDESFREGKLNLFEDDIFWIEADLLQPLTVEEINDLVVSMNCFPVINRELNESAHSLVKGSNVIPLLTDDLFFEVERVADSRDQVYLPVSSFDNERESGKSYMIRQGGIARFDSRDARQTIAHLIDLVRDEAAAFSVNGAELIAFELKQLDQILSRLKQRNETIDAVHDLHSYLIIQSNAEFERINVQFWSVSGEQANHIRPGTRLSAYRGGDLNDKSIMLFTQTVGGRQKLPVEDRLNVLRRSLLSKGRIVTSEDIKALCFELFGSHLNQVEIKKGTMLQHGPGKGISRTIDIYLTLMASHELSEEELFHRKENLKVRLKQESVNLLPYRIFVD